MEAKKTEALAIVSKRVKPVIVRQKENEFIPKVKVKMDDGTAVLVPQDAEANRNSTIVLAELARQFVAAQLKLISSHNRIMTPQETKELMTAVKIVNEMSIVAHENIMIPTDKPIKTSDSATGNMLKAVEAAAKGVASGNAEAAQKAVEKFMKMGKEAKQAQSIDVVATEVK
jgi:hypothetical protein